MGTTVTNQVYLLTGGNLGNRKSYLHAATIAITQQCGPVVAASPIYETEAWGPAAAPYLNQALLIETTASAPLLLQIILDIEESLGRVRQERYGPRTIDIDILLFNDNIIHQAGLTVPHPQLPHRRFALQCLVHIAADVVHPVLDKTVGELLQECTDPLWAKLYVPERP